MIISSNMPTPGGPPRLPGSPASGSAPQVVDGLGPSVSGNDMTALDKLREYAKQPVGTPINPNATREFKTQPPDKSYWTSSETIAAALATAATNVEEKVRTGLAAEKADDYIRRQILKFQAAKNTAEGTQTGSRLVHREQLHGGGAEIHWNPNLNALINLFDKDSSQALVRISDAAAGANPDGKTMYGFALEIFNGERPTDILLTGGSPKSEVSQAKSPEAQLALFNMLNPSSKVGGIGRILWEVGPIDGPKMLMDVGKMRTIHESLSDIEAWSRAPFAVTGKDGKEYLVKMRVKPTSQPEPGQVTGETTSEKQKSEFSSKLRTGDARWSLDFQFMQPGDDPHDPRSLWKGDWVTAAEVVLPKVTDEAEARQLAEAAQETKFNVWKGKEPYSTSPDKNVLRPWGELNRARLAAYQASAAGWS